MQPKETVVEVHNTAIEVHFCADSIPTLAAFGGDLALAFRPSEEE
jgi:Autophagy-related protein 2 CAD motif